MTIAAEPTRTRRTLVPCAVAWIGEDWAAVARMDRAGSISTSAVHRGDETEPSYLELIARILGDAQRVVVLGPSSMRLALERAYVALYRWPDRLIDVEPSDAIGERELIERLRTLSGTVND